MLWICIFGSHKMNGNLEKIAHFFAGGGFYYEEIFVQKFGLDSRRNHAEKIKEIFEIGG